MSETTATESLVTPPTETTTPLDQSLIGVETEAVASTETTTEETQKPEGETEAVVEVVPLTRDQIVLPEGFAPADEALDKFVETLNNSELTAQERATALINLQAEVMTAASEASSAAWTSMQDQWRDEVKADAEVGGDKMQPTLDSINRLVSEYGSKELVDVFGLTGAGNNIHMIKFLSKISGVLTEGGYATGTPASSETTAAQRMFPSMKG